MSDSRPFPVELMASFVDELKGGAGDWNSLLLEPRFGALRARQRWFSDRQKGMFYRLLSPSRRQAFLELQAGSGIVSACLSEDYELGYSLEPRASFADFIELRFRSDGIVNVEVLRAGGPGIPLNDASVDLVAIDSPTSVRIADSERADLELAEDALLSEIRRCLRTDGRLIMAVDNAWQLPQSLTVPELSGDGGSGGMVVIRPRSPFGYRRLLRRAGFENPRFFVVKPRRQLPIDIYSHHREALDLLYRKYDSRSRMCRMLKWTSDIARVPYLAAYFQPSYYLVGDCKA